MEPENIQHNHQEESGLSHQKHSSGNPKNKRRTRKDEEGRDYNCLCGKSYLSYPALYTHIKTKHEGQLSTFLIKHCNNGSTSKAGNHKNSDEQHTKQLFNKQDLQQLKMLLYKYFQSRQRATPIPEIMKNVTLAEKQYLQPLMNYWIQSTDRECSKSDDNEVKKFANKIEKKSQSSGHISADYVFGRFLYDMNKRVSLQCIIFLARFIIMIRRAMSFSKQNAKYCEQNTASMIPTIFNELILDHLLTTEHYGKNPNINIDSNPKTERIEAEPILQDEKSICKILNLLANWMYNQNYTNYTVRYKQQRQ